MTCLLFLSSLSGAYLDVIVDALMVTHSRQDEDEGGDQLTTLSWGALGAGGAFGSLFGGYLSEYAHPKWSILLYSMFGLVVMCLGLMLEEKEQQLSAEIKNKPLSKVFLDNLKQVREAMLMPEIYQTIAFLLCCSFTGPSFGTFWYFYQLNVVKFSKF